MRKIGFWLALMSITAFASAQQINPDVVNVSGNSAVYGSGYLAWSVGEAVVGQAQTASVTVKQGFLQPGPSSLQVFFVRLYLQGLWNGSGLNKAQGTSGDAYPGLVADKVDIELHPVADYASTAYSQTNVNLTTEGNAAIQLQTALVGDYYLTVRHRNTLATTSQAININGNGLSYDFTAMASRAFGNNQVELGEGIFGFYAGDANQDGSINATDLSLIGNSAMVFETGYAVADLTGDGVVDALDLIVADNNAANAVQTIEP